MAKNKRFAISSLALYLIGKDIRPCQYVLNGIIDLIISSRSSDLLLSPISQTYLGKYYFEEGLSSVSLIIETKNFRCSLLCL